MKPTLALLVALTASGCLSQARRAMRTDALLVTRYAGAPIQATVAGLDALLDTLPAVSGSSTEVAGRGMGTYCLSLARPCLESRMSPDLKSRSFELHWGNQRQHFDAQETDAGLRVTNPVQWGPMERWLFSALDPNAETLRESAQELANAQVDLSERKQVSLSSFWVQARATASLFERVGVQVQGGYRRWLSQYLLLSGGGGYERTLAGPLGEPRDAALITARVEISSFDEVWQRAHLGLPVLSGYFGLTGVVTAASGTLGWTTRAFVGMSCVVPLSVELGVSVSPTLGPPPNFYMAVGLGI